jgi:dTDP-4-dehydrorhamnose reductase
LIKRDKKVASKKGLKFLITGSKSGLGQYLHERFDGAEWSRNVDASLQAQIEDEGVDVIVHCAFNSRVETAKRDFYQYISDNLLLTEKLTRVPHKKFIFISTVDVYPKNGKVSHEDDTIDPNEVANIYGTTKLMSEAIVSNECADFLILRCSALLGKYARQNSLMRILENDVCELTLSAQSCFNYVLHKDVGDFILHTLDDDIQGVYNFVSNQNVALGDIAKFFGREPHFGSYRYDAGVVSNAKIVSTFPPIDRSSMDAVIFFTEEKYGLQ